MVLFVRGAAFGAAGALVPAGGVSSEAGFPALAAVSVY
jgi:hypothetical protein